MSGQESRLTMNGSALSPAEVPGAAPARPTVNTLGSPLDMARADGHLPEPRAAGRHRAL